MKRKTYTIKVAKVGTPEQSAAIVRQIVKDALIKVIERNRAVAHNLDEVLEKYIPVRECTPSNACVITRLET